MTCGSAPLHIWPVLDAEAFEVEAFASCLDLAHILSDPGRALQVLPNDALKVLTTVIEWSEYRSSLRNPSPTQFKRLTLLCDPHCVWQVLACICPLPPEGSIANRAIHTSWLELQIPKQQQGPWRP